MEDGHIKIILGVKKDVFRKGMIAKGINDRNVDIYWIATNDERSVQVSTYEKAEGDFDKSRCLEIDGVWYKPSTYSTTKYHTNLVSAVKSYIETRKLSPSKDIKTFLEYESHVNKVLDETTKLIKGEIDIEQLLKDR